MFKYVATIAAVAASVQAEEAFKLKTFTSTDCSGTAFVDTTLSFGKCVVTPEEIMVTELNDAKFSVLKYSPDAATEFYMFTNKDSCEEYGNKFNPNVEAAFIRSPGFGCKQCEKCGNVKSIWTEKADDGQESTKTETKVKEDSAASTVAISSAAVAAAVAAMFF